MPGAALNIQQVFSYDTVNRIKSFTDNGALNSSGLPLERDFGYTTAGPTSSSTQAENMYVSRNDSPLPLSTLAPADATAFDSAGTNRLRSSDPATGQTATYDNAGNLLSVGNGSTTTYRFTYDAENRQVTETNSSGQQAQYVYDGEGRRDRARTRRRLSEPEGKPGQ